MGTFITGSYLDLLGNTDEELSQTDPLVMNLLVARSIPALENLEASIIDLNGDREHLASCLATKRGRIRASGSVHLGPCSNR
jgi:hypothetical protein